MTPKLKRLHEITSTKLIVCLVQRTWVKDIVRIFVERVPTVKAWCTRTKNWWKYTIVIENSRNVQGGVPPSEECFSLFHSTLLGGRARGGPLRFKKQLCEISLEPATKSRDIIEVLIFVVLAIFTHIIRGSRIRSVRRGCLTLTFQLEVQPSTQLKDGDGVVAILGDHNAACTIIATPLQRGPNALESQVYPTLHHVRLDMPLSRNQSLWPDVESWESCVREYQNQERLQENIPSTWKIYSRSVFVWNECSGEIPWAWINELLIAAWLLALQEAMHTSWP